MATTITSDNTTPRTATSAKCSTGDLLLLLVAPLYHWSYHPKLLTLQWPPACRTILDLLGVSLTLLEIVEEYPAVILFVPPKLPSQPVPLWARAVQDDRRR
jgi:hypothetical protein